MRCTTKEWQSTNISRNSPEGSNRRQDQWTAVYVGDISEEKQTRQGISAPENECYQFPSSQGLSSVHIVVLQQRWPCCAQVLHREQQLPAPANDDAPGGNDNKQRADDDHAVQCKECGRYFRRSGDMKRHKCRSERMRPIEDQRGAVQCGHCNRWFRSKGGLAVHKCILPLSPAHEK